MNDIGWAQESITEGPRALELFTDRREPIRRFCEYLNNEPPREQILVFYGAAGNGKSLLLRLLRERYCKRLRADNWDYVKNVPTADFAAHIENAEDAEMLPSVLLDFKESARDAFNSLLALRRGLARNRFAFPLFDFSCVWYLHKINQLTDVRLKNLFPVEEMDLLTELATLLTESKYFIPVSVVLKLFGKYQKEKFTLRWQRRGVDESFVERIQRMDHQTQLIEKLPSIFATDLNRTVASAQAPRRIVLFFDTYESFWGPNDRELSTAAFSQRDEWIRRLLSALKREAGVVVVVAGQDRPRWGEAFTCKIPDSSVDAHCIGNLSIADARRYLTRAGITDRGIQKCLVEYATVAPEEAHPLCLGLCADLVVASAREGHMLCPTDFGTAVQTTDKLAQLFERLLRYVNVRIETSLHAISACRAFNREVYQKLAAEFSLENTDAAFRVLTARFSFVQPVEGRGEGWYHIHPLLRRFVRETNPEVVGRADKLLEEYYRNKAEGGDVTARAEQVFHSNRLDPRLGVSRFIDLLESAVDNGDYGLANALLDIRGDLIVETDLQLGQILNVTGAYFSSLARHRLAKAAFTTSIALLTRAQDGEEHVEASNKKAFTLLNLGELQLELARYSLAEKSFRQAIASCNRALKVMPEHVEANHHRATGFTSLGDLQRECSKYGNALDSYKTAAAGSEDALRYNPNHTESHNNKGYALASIGEILAIEQEYTEALRNYGAAIASYNEALIRAPTQTIYHNNKAWAMVSIGEAHAGLRHYDEAINSYRDAIEIYEEILRGAPGDVIVLGNKARALRRMAEAQIELSRDEEASRSYNDGLASCAEALRLAPDETWVHNSRGLVLVGLGELDVKLLKSEEAISAFRAAISSCKETLRNAPDDIEAQKCRGNALEKLGHLKIDLQDQREGIKSLGSALRTFSRVHEISPSDEEATSAIGRLKGYLKGE
jgi:tetratricopeptide (TPR) repeat protein